MSNKFSLITDGLVKNNPTFVLVLGICPTLATTTSAINGMEMGLATMFVLILSNIFISLIAPMVPDKVRIPTYIVVIATFVTLLQLLMQAFVPDVYATLGLFIPLIVVNCIVLGRAEAFANKHSVERLRLRMEVHRRRRHPGFRHGPRRIHRAGLSARTVQQVPC